MNQYERENVEQIKNEIRAYEEKSGEMPKEKMAYYIYRRMGQIYSYREAYALLEVLHSMKEYMKKIEMFQEGTDENGVAICTDMNKACVEFMREMGINAKYLAVEADETPLYHPDGCFEVEGKYYFFNLVPDLMRIQTGMRTRNFGTSQQRLKEKFKNGIPDYDREYVLLRINEENDGEPFTEIPEETIEKWDNEFEFTYKGLYTNEVLELMDKECYDKKFMEEFFETNQPDELVQRKFEFIMKYVGIIKTIRDKKMGNVEAEEYYLKLFEKIMTKQEFNEYVTLCMGFIEENQRRKSKKIVIIQKEKENVYYLYNGEKQIYEKVEKEELIKQGIQYYSYEKRADVPITTLIDKKEKELVAKKQKHSEDIML